jgi:hypothetical protein
MKCKTAAFSCYRVALVSTILSFALVPMHFYVSCEMSWRIGLCGGVLLIITVALAVVDRSVRMGFPLTLAVIALLAHGLCAH